MMTHNVVGAQLAARIQNTIPLALDGRGVRGEGVLRCAKNSRSLAALLLPLAFFLAPDPVLAQNECGGDPVLDVGDDTYNCPDASYPDGVTYNADGNLTVNFTNGGITEVEDVGIDLSAAGGDGIFFDSQTTATEIESRAVTGPLLNVTTVDGDIDIDTEEMDADGQTPQGVTHAIFAESTGSGGIDIHTTGNVDAGGSSNPADSIGIEAITGSGSLTITAAGEVQGNDAAIDATTGTGLLTVNVTGGSGTVGGPSDVGIRTDSGGGTIVNIGTGRSVDNGIQSTGDTLTLNNDGTVNGVLDFSGLSGGYTFDNNAGATWDADEFSVVQVGNLAGGTMNNAGTIVLGRNNVISAPGVPYTAIGDNAVLEFGSAVLDGGGQFDCTSPTVAGCLDLRGGTTSGQTAILIGTAITNPNPFLQTLDTPISPGVVLIDVGGGSTQADHFVLHPDSFETFDNDPGDGTDQEEIPVYAEDSVYGAILETGGLFDYALLYNPNTQQHLLASVPNPQGLEYAAMIHESLSVWHTTSDAVAGRQADLRDGGERGGWVRVFTDKSERDFKPSVTTHGNTFTYDRSYELDTRGAVAGYDLTADDSHVLGVHLGFMATRLDHDDSQTKDETTFPSSVTFGAYGGWWNDTGLTLDGTINVNLLDIEHDVRSGLEDTKTNVITTGIRGEAGWRFPMAESFYVQPHVIAAYAYADVERLNMRDYDAKFEDEQSQRAALGVRLGGEQKLSGDRYSRVKYWLTARAWEEYAEDGNLQFAVEGGDPLVIEDDISEGFEEVGLGVSLTGPDENLEIFLSGNVRSGDQTDGNNVTIGARMNW